MSCTLHNPSQYGLTFKINGIIGLIYGQLNAEIRLDYRQCSVPNRSIVRTRRPLVYTRPGNKAVEWRWEVLGLVHFCLTLYGTVSTNEPKRPFTALKPSARHNHPLRRFKFTCYVDKCPSPVVCVECGHPNFWRFQRWTPKLNVIFLPSSNTVLLKGERKM